MNISTNEFSDLGNIMIIPVFEHTEKAPNNTTIGLSRSASIAIKSAISSERCDGKEGSLISIWTKDCQIILLGMGKVEELDSRKARNIGARCFADLPKNHGKNLVIRFTTGWSVTNMAAFAE